MRRLSGTAVVLVVVLSTALSGALGVLLATLAATEPHPPADALAVGQPFKTAVPAAAGTTTSVGLIPIPTGFTRSEHGDRSVELTADEGRQRIVISEISETDGVDAGVLTQDLINGDRRTLDVNTQICADDGTDTATMTVTGGTVTGAYLPLCVSVVPQNAPAFTARDYYYTALAQRDGHPVALVVEIFASTDRFPALVSSLSGFVPSILWSASPP